MTKSSTYIDQIMFNGVDIEFVGFSRFYNVVDSKYFSRFSVILDIAKPRIELQHIFVGFES